MIAPPGAPGSRPMETLMEVRDLTINGIIDRISFRLHRGEIIDVAAPDGTVQYEVLDFRAA